MVGAVTASSEFAAGKWRENAMGVHDFALESNGAFTDTVDSMPAELFEPVFNFCGGNDDASEHPPGITGDSLIDCDNMMQRSFGMYTENVAFNFFGMIWSVIDVDNDGILNFIEFKQGLTGLVTANAQTTMQLFDENQNGLIDHDELLKFQDAYAQVMNKA